MKKIFLTFATAALISVSAFAADGGKKVSENTASVSYAVQQEFAADFATAQNVSWTVNKNCQKADFYVDGVRKTAFYNLAGDFLGTTQSVAYSVMPAKVQKDIAEQYKGFTPGDVIVFQANTAFNNNIDETSYFIDLKSAKEELLVRVTSNGNVNFFKEIK